MKLRMERVIVPFPHRQTPTHSLPTSISFAGTSIRSVDFDDFLNKYKHVSRLQLENLRDTLYNFKSFDIQVHYLNEKNMFWSRKGRQHYEAGSLLELLSAQILDINKPIAICGRIYIQFFHIHDGHTVVHDVFNRECHDPQVLDSTNPYLTLTFPLEEFCYEPPEIIPVQETKIIVDLWDAHEKIEFARDTLLLEDVSIDEYERVELKVIRGTCGSLALGYFSMLFGIHCYVDVSFYQRLEDKTRTVLNVYGDIVLRYGNTHGNYVNEGCTIFRKLSHEFQPVDLSTPESINLLKWWLSMPAYSSIILDFDLFDFDTKTPIFNGAVALVPNIWNFSEGFAINDFVMMVSAEWFSRIPDVRRLVSDADDGDKEDEEEEEYVLRNNPWYHHTSVPGLFDSAAFEVFTIFIGRQKMLKSVRLFGTIEVVSSLSNSFYIFKRDEEDAFELSEHSRFLPILNSSIYLSFRHSLKMKFDLKDVDGNLFINGFIEWCKYTLTQSPSRYDSQLCSVVPGKHGFAAVHYSIFEWAFQANIEAKYKLKKSGAYAVYGSLITEYDTYDYSTSFLKDCYRIVLFERVEEDMLRLGIDGKIALSRSTIIVPADSSALIIEANVKVIDLSTGVTCQDLSRLEIKAGIESASMETEVCIIDFYFKWKTEE